jgi:hypothetical protein
MSETITNDEQLLDQMRQQLTAQRDVGPKRRAVILTADVMETIPAMIEAGMRKQEIADLLGCTPSTLQVQCSKRGISLRKGGKLPPAKTLLIGAQAKLTLSHEAAIKLQARAWRSGMSEETLASALLEVIVQDDLFAAVLDLESA